jgi:hypothetical protein
MGFRFPVRAYTSAQLQLMATPARATDLEALPHVFHDVQAFTSATTLALRFFQAVQATVDLGNFLAAGQLPDPMWFQPFYFGCDPLVLPTTGAATVVGALDDMDRLVMTTRPTVNMQIAGKPYIQDIPLSFFHTSGGATGLGGGIAAGPLTTAAVANNSIPDGGWCTYGSFVIPPKQNIAVVATWPAVVTINASPVNVRFWVAGVWFRRVL